GLNMQPIRRLKRTWGKVQMEKFQQLEQYINVSKNFATYSPTLKVAMEEAEKYGWKTDKIVIPFTSIVLQDVYFIKTHSKDYTTAGGINLKLLIVFFCIALMLASFACEPPASIGEKEKHRSLQKSLNTSSS
ncbi:unnamed protein product, partial [Rotaria sp. Silwood2]